MINESSHIFLYCLLTHVSYTLRLKVRNHLHKVLCVKKSTIFILNTWLHSPAISFWTQRSLLFVPHLWRLRPSLWQQLSPAAALLLETHKLRPAQPTPSMIPDETWTLVIVVGKCKDYTNDPAVWSEKCMFGFKIEILMHFIQFTTITIICSKI